MLGMRTRFWCALAVLFFVGSAPAVAQLTTFFSDDFERPDGLLDGWTIHQGAWNIVGGALEAGPAAGGGQAGEQQAFAGDPPLVLPAGSDYVISFDWEYLAPEDSQPVGRHAGCFFEFNQPGVRWDAATSGYQLWWIDRDSDRGFTLARWNDGGGFTTLNPPGGTFDLFPNPPTNVRIEVTGDRIQVYGDDVLAIDVTDGTYRGGNFGLWTWDGAGNYVRFDNVEVLADVPEVAACFTFSPEAPTEGTDMFFDASCSFPSEEIVSYSWDFGDGNSAMGAVVEHTYAFADSYTVTLTVENGDGATDSTSQVIGVSGTCLPYSDDFERAEGPLDGDWTIFQGEWNITAEGQLNTMATGGGGQPNENWAWAGSPPCVVEGDFEAQWEMQFLNNPADGVGRHGGLMIYAGEPTIRWGNTGYTIWWIDRGSDFGIVIMRWPDLAYVSAGTFDLLPEPPSLWKVKVVGPNIQVFADNVMVVDAVDESYRSGSVGFWAYGNNQNILFDNLVIDEEITVAEPIACFNVDNSTPRTGETINLDASCSVEAGDPITDYAWDFGDGTMGSGETVQKSYEFSDIYTVTLTITAGAQTATTTREISVTGAVTEFSDDFERPDGEVDGWTVTSGNWRLNGGRLATGPTTGEEWIWAGSPPVVAPGNAVYTFDMSFLSPGSNPDVGRHAGFQFSCDRPTQRSGGGAFSGYFIDWIDRASDRGVRLTRVDAGAFNLLVGGQMDLAPQDPPLEWRVEVSGDNIKVFGDDELYIDFDDGTYRGGFFGFWSWTGDQEVEFDNLNMTSEALTPCFTTSPASGIVAGTDITFDASCSSVFGGGAEIVSYAWDFGDGASAMGVAAEHTYEFADTYTVSLTIEDDGGNMATLDRSVIVSETLAPFADCFDRDDGPLDGWTIHAGDWNIVDVGLVAGPAQGGGQGGEQQAFAGDPPGLLPPNYTISFDWEYLAPEDSQPVGRHAGCFFEFNQPGIRWDGSTSGYQLWWIDRESDRGFSLARWDGGGLNVLQAGTFELFPNPPTNVRIEVNGDQIQVYGDDVLAIDVTDGTYRGGLFGLWTWDGAGNHVRFDNVQIGVDELPPCGDLPGKMFVRGDTNTDGGINIADPVFLLNNLFGGGPASTCTEATDINDDGGVNIADPVYLLNRLFGGGPPVPPPNPNCGEDPNNLMPVFDCASFPPCGA